jgi:hypothetical protein
LANHGITDNHDGTYTITSGADDFQYMIKTSNKGTWSTANVDVTAPEPHLSGTELLQNWDFEQDNANNANGFIDLAAITGWENEGTSQPMQVQHECVPTVSLNFASFWRPQARLIRQDRGRKHCAMTARRSIMTTCRSEGGLIPTDSYLRLTGGVSRKTDAGGGYFYFVTLR